VTDSTDDFAALFEASIKAKRFKEGQTIEGRIVAIGPEVAFVELEPGVEALAHASTFDPSGRSDAWSSQVAPGTTAAFEILSIDVGKKRIGVALVPEGSSRAAAPEGVEREDAAPEQGFRPLADKLRGALKPQD